MAEILGLGLTHYPPLCLPDADMAGVLGMTLRDPSIPAREKEPKNWPAAMQAEWSDDSDGHDDCSSEFSRIGSAQSDFELAVSEYESECQ
jgi:hypothetical protein